MEGREEERTMSEKAQNRLKIEGKARGGCLGTQTSLSLQKKGYKMQGSLNQFKNFGHFTFKIEESLCSFFRIAKFDQQAGLICAILHLGS